MDLFSYIKNYGHIDILMINDIDALIFARLSYLHWEVIQDKFPIRIEEVIKYLKEMNNNHLDEKLIIMLAKAKRFQKIVLTRFQSILDVQKEEQFAALTINFKDNSSYISFRGTIKNLTAYKEDLNMSYKIVPAQIDALKYLSYEHDKYLYVGGHSKGGNLAMYASINSRFWLRNRIKKVYNFDGPGFLSLNDKFKKMKEKIINICPEGDIVGCLLYNNAKKHYIKTLRQGIEAHNVYYWQVDSTNFVFGKVTADSIAFSYANIRVNTIIPNHKKRIIIDYFFELLEKRHLKSIKELTLDEIKKILNDLPSLEIKEKEELIKMGKLFFKLAFLKPVKLIRKEDKTRMKK